MFSSRFHGHLTLHLRGGLGNQLFQATAASFFADRLKVDVILDDSAIIRHRDKSRRTWLRRMDIQRLFNNEKMEWKPFGLSLLSSTLSLPKDGTVELNESDLLQLYELDRDIHVADWFQKAKYVEAVKPGLYPEDSAEIRNNVNEEIYRIRNSDGLGAIHIRLGDFRQTQWGVLSGEWYVQALRKLIDRRELRRIDCYSDEIDAAREILKPLNKKVVIQYPEEKFKFLPHELLWTLSTYQSLISSNSSLSWWASYLNRTKNPLILCDWGDDLFLERWEKFQL